MSGNQINILNSDTLLTTIEKSLNYLLLVFPLIRRVGGDNHLVGLPLPNTQNCLLQKLYKM